MEKQPSRRGFMKMVGAGVMGGATVKAFDLLDKKVKPDSTDEQPSFPEKSFEELLADFKQDVAWFEQEKDALEHPISLVSFIEHYEGTESFKGNERLVRDAITDLRAKIEQLDHVITGLEASIANPGYSTEDARKSLDLFTKLGMEFEKAGKEALLLPEYEKVLMRFTDRASRRSNPELYSDKI